MSEHRLSAKLLLRYAPYNEWVNSNVILGAGEAAVAVFPAPEPTDPPRAFGIKMGDGYHYFSELPWIQALAADVYDWAKTAIKPIYTANEINGLAEYIAAHTSGGGGGSGGSGSGGSGNYQIVYDNASSKYILQQYNNEAGEWQDTNSEIDLSSILNRIDTIERWANGAKTNLGNIYDPITAIVYDELLTYINRLDVNDVAVAHQFVTSVSEQDGKITVSRSILTADDISSGVFTTARGGTGLSRVDEDQVLIGSESGNITTKTFVTEIDTLDRNSFATTGAIIDYVNSATAGLTGAMHFIGEAATVIDGTTHSRVDPQIRGYDFSNAQPGDVVLANNAQEYVWTGTNWRLLGDEGSYAIKGSIKNVDIAEDAMIAQSKINNLAETLDTKVDKIEGKDLSSNDYTDLDKEKLEGIEDEAQVNLIEHIFLNETEIVPIEKAINLQIPVLTEEQLASINAAQANVIEHIFVNGTEINPSTINQLPKSIGINFIQYTQEEKDKLHDIQAGAEVNKVETIVINGTEYTPNNNKQVEITIDQAALNLNVLEGARYPVGNTYADIDITNKKLELSQVAATGNIDHLVQTSGTYVIFNCGSSTEVI